MTKNHRAALAGFQRAVAADPTWPVPAYNAASAQQLLGDQAAAIATLAPWLASAPVRTYLQIQQDPELAPLAGRAEVKAVEAVRPGDITVTPSGIAGAAAYSATHGLVAITREEASWGASNFLRDIELYDAKGARVATLPLVRMDETNPDCYADTPPRTSCELATGAVKAVAARAASVQARLRALGFSTAKTEAGTMSDDGAGKRKVRFASRRLGLVERDGQLRLLRNNTELATARLASARLSAALVVDEMDAVVVWSGRPGAEGCEGTDPTSVQLVRFER